MTRIEQDTVYDYFQEDAEDDGPQVVRNKKFVARPMDFEDAVMQMELLGHNFFVYRNAHSECAVQTLGRQLRAD